MAQTPFIPTYRRFALYGLILLALALVSTVVFVFATEDRQLSPDESFPEPVVLDPEKRPHFIFSVSARTHDLSLNRFVDRFMRVCMMGKYSEFRVMLSSRRPPILPPRFESNFNALKEVRILGIEKVPSAAGADPIYIMMAEYELQDFAAAKGEKRARQVHVALTREDHEWRIGPVPHGAIEAIRAYQARTATQPAERAPQPAATSPSPPAVQSSGAGANRRARLGS